MSAQVFISHSTKDRAATERVLRALEAQHIRCWYAPRDIPAGSNYMGTINRAIQKSELFLVVLSGNANQSIEMKKEASIANRRQMPMIPFRIDFAVLDDDWAFEISVRQYVDGSDNIARAIPILVGQVQSALANRQYTTARPIIERRSEDRQPPPRSASLWEVVSGRSRSFVPLAVIGIAGLVIFFVASAVMIAGGGHRPVDPQVAHTGPGAPASATSSVLPTKSQANAQTVAPTPTPSLTQPPRIQNVVTVVPRPATQGTGMETKYGGGDSKVNMDNEGPSEWRNRP